MIQQHGKTFASVAELRRFRGAFQRWQFKDGTKGSIKWYPEPSVFGIFSADTGATFTVADSEVKPLGNGG